MNCLPTKIPAPETFDIPAIRERYRQERDKRLRDEGQSQYVRPTGEVVEDYTADPHKPQIQRDPISEDIDVIILGAGWGGTLAAYHLVNEGVTSFRNVDTAGDFGGVWYWNRYPGIQCDNDAYCYLPLLEETGFSATPARSPRSSALRTARSFTPTSTRLSGMTACSAGG